jgi:hypothetical protein
MPFDQPSGTGAPLNDRQRRLLAAFANHLRARGVYAPGQADFAAFGSFSRIQRLHKALAVAAPVWCAECRLAMTAKLAEMWRQEREGVAPAPRNAPALSVPRSALPKRWLRELDEMRAIRRELDRGVMSLDDRMPPSAKVLRKLEATLRQLAWEAGAAGVAPGLDIAPVSAFLAGLDRRGRAPTTKVARLRELLLFAAWIGDETAAVQAMRREKNLQERLAARRRKRKEVWLLQHRIQVVDCWLIAEDLLIRALALASGLPRRRLLLHALAIAFAVVCPLRIGDLPRIRIGEHLVRERGLWAFEIVAAKNLFDYDPGPLWPELTPFIDAVVLDGRDPLDIAARVRAMQGAPLFSKDGVRPFSEEWISTVWRRHIGTGVHIVRTLWHEEAAEDGGTWMALALCGQRSAQTARHYTLKAARKRAAKRGRALLARARAKRRASGKG